MKKTLLVLVTLLAILALAACGAKVASGGTDVENDFYQDLPSTKPPTKDAFTLLASGTAEPTEYLLGDVNWDGKVTNLDLLLIFKYIYNPELYPLGTAPTAPSKEHEIIIHDAKASTCTEVGWNAYVTCANCDYTTYVELETIDHDIVHHAAKAPTYTEIGWDAYETCTNCSYSTYVELPILTMPYTEGLAFILNNAGTEYTVTNYTGTDTEVVIPAIYNGLPVTSIGFGAFIDCTSLTYACALGKNASKKSI